MSVRAQVLSRPRTASAGTRWPARAAERLWLALIALVAAVPRLLGLGEQSLWIDEIRGYYGQHGLPLLREVRETFGPLDPPLTFAVFRFMGHLPFGLETNLRLVPALAGVAEVVCLAGLLRALAPRHRAFPLVAAALLALAPFAVRYSQEARYYSIESALHLATWWFAVRLARSRNPRDWAIWVALSVIAVYSHVFAWLFLGVQAGMLIVVSLLRSRVSLRPPRAIGTVAGVAIVVACFLPWALWEAAYWLTDASDDRSAFVGPSRLLPAEPDAEFAGWLAQSLFADATPGHSPLAVVLAGAALAAPLIARGTLRWIAAGSLLYVLVMVEFTYATARVAHTYLAFRRFEFLLPVLLACVAAGIAGLYGRLDGASEWRLWTARVTATVLTGALLAGSFVATRRVLDEEKTNYKAAAREVLAAPPDTHVIFGKFNNAPATDWYATMRRYLRHHGVTRDIQSVRTLRPDRLPPSGEVLWITGGPSKDPRFVTQPLNDLDRLAVIGGDRSVGSFVIPLYVLRSRYSSTAELAEQRRAILKIGSMRWAG